MKTPKSSEKTNTIINAALAGTNTFVFSMVLMLTINWSFAMHRLVTLACHDQSSWWKIVIIVLIFVILFPLLFISKGIAARNATRIEYIYRNLLAEIIANKCAYVVNKLFEFYEKRISLSADYIDTNFDFKVLLKSTLATFPTQLNDALNFPIKDIKMSKILGKTIFDTQEIKPEVLAQDIFDEINKIFWRYIKLQGGFIWFLLVNIAAMVGAVLSGVF